MNDRTIARYSGGRDLPGPVTCAICDCRLQEVPGMDGSAWRHYQVTPGQDARGCRTECLELLHDRDGNVLAFRSLESLMTPGSEPTPA